MKKQLSGKDNMPPPELLLHLQKIGVMPLDFFPYIKEKKRMS